MRPNFLIVGMGRSGSLWTSAMLNAHPDIASFPSMPFHTTSREKRVGEVHFFNTLATSAAITLHIKPMYFRNNHHLVEG